MAKENSPSIIFIDEVDAIATKRFDAQTGADREVQRILIELLTQARYVQCNRLCRRHLYHCYRLCRRRHRCPAIAVADWATQIVNALNVLMASIVLAKGLHFSCPLIVRMLAMPPLLGLADGRL